MHPFFPRYYRLQGREVVPIAGNDVERSMAFAAMLADIDTRTVAKEMIGHAEVSTVFLGAAHGYRDGVPVLFETMVFDRHKNEELCLRATTYAQALDQHNLVVNQLRARHAMPQPTRRSISPRRIKKALARHRAGKAPAGRVERQILRRTGLLTR